MEPKGIGLSFILIGLDKINLYISFSNIFNSAYYQKRIMVQCLVTGKTTEPYLVPKKIRIKCEYQESCGACAIPNSVLEINADNDNLIQFIDSKQTQFLGIIKNLIKRSCKTIQYEVEEVQNVERIFISQPTGRFRERHSTTHVAYYVGYGIDANYNYDFRGVPTIDPKDQIVAVIFDHAKKLKTDIETFKLTPEIHEQLKKFQIADPNPEKIYDYLHKLYDVYAHNITQIYDRFDLHLAVDLAVHTVISFKFANEFVKKGWADILIIGDSRTGKGFVSERLTQYYDVGEVASADNCTIPGLVGGVDMYDGHRAISWGRIPLNDLGLLILDEGGKLGDNWESLDRIRSEGIANVEKIIKSVTNARTRLITLANPERSISRYSYGVQAIRDVLKKNENITRCDYALVVAETEINLDSVHQRRVELPEIHSREAEQNLVLWTWSRQTDEIEFTEDSIKCIYAQSKIIAGQYSSEIPLIQGASVRIKIAKIAVAFASRLYSCSEDGKKLVVHDYHVMCAIIFLNAIYKKAVAGYYTMSQLTRTLQATYTDEDIAYVEKYVSSFVNDRDELCKCLLSNNFITVKDIAEHLNFSQEIATEIVSKLLKHNMIIKKMANSYVKNKHFTDWLKTQVLKTGGMDGN